MFMLLFLFFFSLSLGFCYSSSSRPTAVIYCTTRVVLKLFELIVMHLIILASYI